jgi:formate/nitrite transporter FocA (FNT family)
VAVVLGNVIGGSVLVGLVYYLIYIRRPPPAA